MNNAFDILPYQKQQRIINAALEIFSKNEYKQANTEDIAHLAGISKGSLFYYFKNKKELYLYLYEYVSTLITELILDSQFKEITDFFELAEHAAKKKVGMLETNPYVLDFIVHYFYLSNETLGADSEVTVSHTAEKLFLQYFKNIDFSKFKENINPKDIYKLMGWAADGYLHEKRKLGEVIDVSELMVEFGKWLKMFKSIAYKEEYQDE